MALEMRVKYREDIRMSEIVDCFMKWIEEHDFITLDKILSVLKPVDVSRDFDNPSLYGWSEYNFSETSERSIDEDFIIVKFSDPIPLDAIWREFWSHKEKEGQKAKTLTNEEIVDLMVSSVEAAEKDWDGRKYRSIKKPDFNEPVFDGLFDPDLVRQPPHYIEGRKYEPRKVIYDWDLNFNLGNAVKYLSRAGRKGDKLEDLRKAIQYIEFEIEELEEVSK